MLLAALEPSHADGAYLGWIRDPEVNRFLEARLLEYDAERLRAYIVAENERANAVLFGMFLHPHRLIGAHRLRC